MKWKVWISKLTILAVLGGFSPLAHAGFDQDYDKVCKGHENATGPKVQSADCISAKNIHRAAKANGWAATGWAAVGAACAAACFVPGIGETWCHGAAALGVVNEFTQMSRAEKSFINGSVSAFGNLAGAAGTAWGLGQLATSIAGDKIAPLAAKVKFNNSCGIAIVSTGLAMYKKYNQNNKNRAADQALYQAAAYIDQNGHPYTDPNANPNTPTVGGTSVKNIGRNAGRYNFDRDSADSGDSNYSNTNAGSDPCSQTLEGASSNTVVSCAAQADPQLESIFRDPKFHESFEKNIGTDLASFLKQTQESGSSPAQSVGAAAGSAKLSSKMITETLEEAYQNAALQNPEFSAGVYAGGGAGSVRTPKKSGFEKNFSNLLKGLTDQALGKNQKKGRNIASSVEFKLANTDPDKLVKDRKISIFDRVSFRYKLSSKQLESLPWASQYNRATTGSY